MVRVDRTRFRIYGVPTESGKHVKRAYGVSFLHGNFRLCIWERTTRKDTDDRYATAGQIARELEYEIAEHPSIWYPVSFKFAPTASFLPVYDLGDWNCVTKGCQLPYCYDDGVVVDQCWRMGDMVGMLLDEIHLSGDVLQFKKQLQMSTNRFPKCLPLVVSPTKWSEDIDPDEFSWCFTGNRPQAYRWSGTQQYNNPPPLACADTLQRVRSYLKFARTSGRRGTGQGRNSSRYEVGEYGQELTPGSATWVFRGGQEAPYGEEETEWA
ncbi:hypothetical protein EDC04DRAFT_2597658 [Pisolithus marmoratus]|nr:hypothetical protein EDC04DRAFT_2597658 [Pisolithus marmoratus]